MDLKTCKRHIERTRGRKYQHPNLNSFALLLSSGHNIQGWTKSAFHNKAQFVLMTC